MDIKYPALLALIQMVLAPLTAPPSSGGVAPTARGRGYANLSVAVGDENCDVIEAGIMKHQRSWYLWLSRKDHLPRKLKQVVRVSHDIIMHEVWSDLIIDGPMPAAADGGKIELSDYREKIVWFYIWRAGWPACREERA